MALDLVAMLRAGRSGGGGGSLPAALGNGLLVLLAAASCLAACEATLRLFHPRYDRLAGSSPERGHHTHGFGAHPDTGTEHRMIYNNLGGRQSRDFPADRLARTVNLAFFGDSQTENVNLPAPYSYTEPLDFLLNDRGSLLARGSPSRTARLGAAPAEGGFSVLNFGEEGYGTGRLYLRWLNSPVREELDHVFYMAFSNDLWDLNIALKHGHVRVGESGEILATRPPHTPAWKRLLGRLHLTYLAIDGWRRIGSGWAEEVVPAPSKRAAGRKRDRRPSEVLAVFRKLVRQWKRAVEADGRTFHIVLLPSPYDWWGTDTRWLADLRKDDPLLADVNHLDLATCFEEVAPGRAGGGTKSAFDYADWRFDNDLHWNAAANMVAATCLYRYLEGVLNLPERSDEDLAGARHAYYQAFLESPDWEGERYTPDVAWAQPTAGGGFARSAEAGEAIVREYLALELAPALDEGWRAAVRAARKAGSVATSPAARGSPSRTARLRAAPAEGSSLARGSPSRTPAEGSWTIYANVDERMLVYVKSPCPADPANARAAGRFFLHVVPFTPEKLSSSQTGTSFLNLDAGPFSPLRRRGGECVFSVPLPDYPLSTVRTGRYTTTGEGAEMAYHNEWSTTFQMPLARSVWVVRASAGERGLEYAKTPCGVADTEARFFLHVHPLREADLPARSEGGYANLDFGWDAGGEVANGNVSCRVSASLPDFPIAFVRTGQFRDGLMSKRLWSVRVEFAEVERLRPPNATDDG